MTVVDQKFSLAPRETSSWPFLVYSDAPVHVEVVVDVSGGKADVSLLREERWPVENFMGVGISGRTSFMGNLDGGTYKIAVANNGAATCAVHVLIVKDLEGHK
jgi:hypothetical protein